MTKEILSALISLSLALLFNFKSNAQTYLVSKTEILGDFDGETYTFQTDLKGYALVRTDERGELAWMSPMRTFGSDSLDFCQNQSRYIVAGITEFNRRSNRISGKPSDYEYWLVPFGQVSPGFFCLPNPTMGHVRIVIDVNSDLKSIMVFDLLARTLETRDCTGMSELQLDLDGYSAGTYMIQGLDSNGSNMQTIKIIKQ